MVICSKKTAVSEKDKLNGQGQVWVWTAIDPASKLIISYLVGDRTLEDCRCFLKNLASRLSCKPLFVSDALDHYANAILETYHTVETLTPTGKPGRPRKPRKVIDPEIDYAVVHKIRKDNRVIKVERKVVYGDPCRVEERLSRSVSQTINTAYVERSNGTLRQRDSHLHRKSMCFAKQKTFFTNRLAIVIANYNFVKPHFTLSNNPDRTTTPRTPAQVMGITNAPWSVLYLLARPVLYQ